MKLAVIVRYTSLCFLIMLIAGCKKPLQERPAMQSTAIKCDSIVLPTNGSATVTVFVHGTRIFPKFYAQELFYSPEGFNHLSQIEAASHMHTIAHALQKADSQRFSIDAFYTFGWNGNLDFNERKKAACDLYNALSELDALYVKKYSKRCRMRIITHSHGGNVALNLASIAHENKDELFYVDELVLLACPVQQETRSFVTDPIFGRIYSVSSPNDVLQVIDPQGLYKEIKQAPLFSERYFNAHPHLLQAKIKQSGRYILHIEFLKEYFYTQLPAIMNAMETWYSTIDAKVLAKGTVPMIDMHGNSVQIYPKVRRNKKTTKE